MENRKQRRIDKKLKRKVAAENPLMEFQADPPLLQGVGPIISTDIGITEAHANLLVANGLQVPPTVRARLLIDTGAYRTLVKHEIADKAGLKLINSKSPIQGIGVDTTGKTYIGRILFICKSRVDDRVAHTIWVDAEIASGKLDGSTTTA